MNSKKLSGFVLIVIGVILVVFAIQSMNRISDRKRQVGMFSSPMSNVSGGNILSGALKGETEKYDTQVILILVCGIAFIVIGGGLVGHHYYRHRK